MKCYQGGVPVYSISVLVINTRSSSSLCNVSDSKMRLQSRLLQPPVLLGPALKPSQAHQSADDVPTMLMPRSFRAGAEHTFQDLF